MTEADYFSAISDLRIAQNQNEVEDNDHYQVIRNEINARLRDPNWHKIKQHAEKLGRETGFGLLAAAYYTVAAARTEGISGLANGLEITLAVLFQPGQADKSKHPATLNALDWMAKRLIDTVKRCEKSHDMLRDLYRCERVCLAFQHAVDTEIIGLQTVHSLLTKKIKGIEKQTPEIQFDINAVQSDRKSRNTKKSGNGIKKFLWFLLVSILAFVLMVLIKELLIPLVSEPIEQAAVPNVLNDQQINEMQQHTAQTVSELTEQTTVPKVLNDQQINEIQQTYGLQEMQQHKAQITAIYLDEIKKRLHQRGTENFQQAEKLLHTLSLLCADDDQVMDQEKAIQAIKRDQQENLEALSERFKKTRTDAANLSRALQRLPSTGREISRIKAMATDLKNYAISLSPLLGRSFYIEENLQKNNTQVAQQELTKLDQQVNALALKVDDLQKMLNQHGPFKE